MNLETTSVQWRHLASTEPSQTRRQNVKLEAGTMTLWPARRRETVSKSEMTHLCEDSPVLTDQARSCKFPTRRPILAVSAQQGAVRNLECPTIKMTDRYRHHAVMCLLFRQSSDSRKHKRQKLQCQRSKHLPTQSWEPASLQCHLHMSPGACKWEEPQRTKIHRLNTPYPSYQQTRRNRRGKRRRSRHRRRRTC